MEYCMICRRTFKKYLYKVFASEDGIFPFKDLLTLFGDSIVFPANRHICVLCLTVVRIIGDFKKVLLQIAVSDTTLESEEVVAAFLGFQSLLQNVPYCVTTDDELYEHFSETVSVQNYSEISGAPNNQILNTYDNDDGSASSDDELTLITPLYSESARVTTSSQDIQAPTPNSQEIQVIMKKRKRRGSQKPFTRRKVRKSRSRLNSALSEETFYPRSRATSRASIMSHTTIASTSRAASAPKYDDNYILINKRTREVGKLQEEDLEIITQKESLEIAYKCNVSVCCQQYESLDQLNKHLISDHEMKSEEIDVIDYNAWLNSYNEKENNKLKFELKYHQPSLIVDSKNKYPCPINSCKKRYECLNDLSKHKITGHHLPEYYPCNECSLKFTCKKDLEYHFEDSHSEINAQCMFCSQHFENIYELYVHLSRHEYFSVPCRYCDKYFLDHTTMMAHRKTHDSEKNKVRIKRSDRHTIKERTDTAVYDNETEEEAVLEFCRVRTQLQAKAEEQEREREDLARILEGIEMQKNAEVIQNDNGIVDRIDNELEDEDQNVPDENVIEDKDETLPIEEDQNLTEEIMIEDKDETLPVDEVQNLTEEIVIEVIQKDENLHKEIVNEIIAEHIINKENVMEQENIENSNNEEIITKENIEMSEENVEITKEMEEEYTNINKTELVSDSEIFHVEKSPKTKINEDLNVENKEIKDKDSKAKEKPHYKVKSSKRNRTNVPNEENIEISKEIQRDKNYTLLFDKETVESPKIKNRTQSTHIFNEETVEVNKDLNIIKNRSQSTQIFNKETVEVNQDLNIVEKEIVKSPKMKNKSRSSQLFNEELYKEKELSIKSETVKSPKIKHKKESTHKETIDLKNIEGAEKIVNIEFINKAEVKSPSIKISLNINNEESSEQTKLISNNSSPDTTSEEIAIIEKDIEVDDEEVLEIFASHSADIVKKSKFDSELKNELYKDFMKRQAVVIIEDSSTIINSLLERNKLKQRQVSKSKRKR